jgi:5'-3' exonuclease
VQIEKAIASKRKQAKFRGKGMDEQEYLPLLWDVEKCLVDARGSLKESWETEYWKWIHPYPDEKEKVCKEYAKGFAWILEYYTGQGNVPKDWMFPAWVPPLWKDLHSVKDEWLTLSKETKEKPILPQEQLTMVLPLASWGLIRGSYKKVPALAPQFWPEQMTFFSAGKRWFWECEALVPVLTAERLREILNSEN